MIHIFAGLHHPAAKT